MKIKHSTRQAIAIALSWLMVFNSFPAQAIAEVLDEGVQPEIVLVDEQAAETDGLADEQLVEGEGSVSETDPAPEPEATPEPEPTPAPAPEPEADPAVSEPAAADADAAATPEPGTERPEVEAELDNTATVHLQDELYMVGFYGSVAEDPDSAHDALAAAIDASPDIELEEDQTADDLAAELLGEESEDQPAGGLSLMSLEPQAATGPNPVPREGFDRKGDGSDIESITLKWLPRSNQVTKTHEPFTDEEQWGEKNAENALLYLDVSERRTNEPLIVRFQMDFALSGEHNYAPGDITISIPAKIFHMRDNNTTSSTDEGKMTGAFLSPMLEAPNVRTDFNWQLIDDTYVFTNTKALSAAARGFIQFQISGLTPNTLVDMDLSDVLQATIEVTTHRYNTLSLLSNPLVAQVNTTEVLTSAYKSTSSAPSMITPEELQEHLDRYGASIPDEIAEAYPNETAYLLVDWYTYGVFSGNQPFTLTGSDYRTDLLAQAPADAEKDANGKPLAYHDGFIIGGDTISTVDFGTVLSGWSSSGTTPYSRVLVAYPHSQFMKDTTYTFTNHVDYELTPLDGIDPKTNKSADGKTTYRFSDPQWLDPIGHFMVFKWGNDNDFGKRADGELTTHSGSFARDDIPTPSLQHLQGYNGIYTKALNQMRDGQDVEIAYTVKSEGYLLPWIWGGSLSDNPPATMVAENYGKRPVTMITEDTGLWVGSQNSHDFELVAGENFEFIGLDFPKPSIGKIKAINVDPVTGAFNAVHAEDGTFEYQPDEDDSKIPAITLEIRRGSSDEWIEWARVDWSSGSCVVTPLNQEATSDGSIVSLPADTVTFRTLVTSGNAYIYYYVRPIVKLYHQSADWQAYIAAGFANSKAPFAEVWNGVEMWAYEYDDVTEGAELGEEIVYLEKNGYDRLFGYTAETSANLYKYAGCDPERDVSYETQSITVHYSAEVRERSVIPELDLYLEALEDRVILPETHATWYDLLPAGMTPVISSVSLVRPGDSITDVYAIPNYKESGRTLLVVECDLTPTPTEYTDNGVRYFEDVPQIRFDATYDLANIFYNGGEDLHNVIVFESSNDTVGTTPGAMGEANDPNGTNNVRTSEAWSYLEDEATLEKRALSGLDDGRNTTSFLYAGAYSDISALAAALSMLQKTVSVNNDGWYSTGLYYDQQKTSEQDVYEGNEERTVFEGGFYTYRVSMMSSQHTETKDMVFYDSLENYQVNNGNNRWDYEILPDGTIQMKPRWRGSFRSIDVSYLRSVGVDVKVYYSTTPELNMQVGDGTQGEINPAIALDSHIGDVWVSADEYTGDLADVHAIAVDARKKTDGSDFKLAEAESIVFYIHMKAPQGEDAATYIEQDAHAYNNIFLDCISADTRVPGEEGSRLFTRQDYTKVGLVENNIDVVKTWEDDGDRDGKRPERIEVTLYQNGVKFDPVAQGLSGYDNFENPIYITEGADGTWTGSFEHLPYASDDGVPLRYTVRETVPEGYTGSLSVDDDQHIVTLKNTHRPETTTFSGKKIWVDDTAETRPASICVEIFDVDDPQTVVSSKEVGPGVDGQWSYEFSDLPRYKVDPATGKGGKEIVYSVRETPVGDSSLDAYKGEVDGTQITNTYHPFGTFAFSKTTLNATETSASQPFSFQLVFTHGEDDEGATIPLFSRYNYTVFNNDGSVDRTGDVTTNETIAILGSQYVHIDGIPMGATVTITEQSLPGWTAQGGYTGEATVKGNATVSKAFTNEYRTSGSINLRATKSIEGRGQLNPNQFRFELTDEDGRVVRTASSRTDNTVTFGAIEYGNADDGKTYTYYMHEVDRGRPGYTYDDAVYRVDVAVADNGDGTMAATPTYYRAGDTAAGEDEWVAMDEADLPAYENSYEASGKTTLRAWKQLQGANIKDYDGKFTFEICRVNDGGTVVVAGSAANNASGEVTFPAIEYTQDDLFDSEGTPCYIEGDNGVRTPGLVFNYVVREVAGEDDGVNYSSEVFGYTVTVTDNGDGTLNCVQGFAEVEEQDGVYVFGEVTDELPVFTNTMKPGELKVTKVVDNPDEAPEGQVFKFRLELENEDGAPIDIDTDSVVVEQTGTSDPITPFMGTRLARSTGGWLLDLLDLLLGTQEAQAAESDVTEWNTWGTCEWGLDSNYVGATLWIRPIEGNEGDFTSTSGSYYSSPWHSKAGIISRVEVPEGKTINLIGNMGYLFNGADDLEYFDAEGFNTSQVTNMENMFYNVALYSRRPLSLDLSSWDTSNVTNMDGVFCHGSSASEDNLVSINITGWNTSKANTFADMFLWRYNLTEVIGLENLDASNVTDMSRMFSSCRKLGGIDLSSWDTSKVTDFSATFSSNRLLTPDSIQGLDTSSATTMKSMFSGCSSLTSLDWLAQWDTSNVRDMESMFSGCSSLTSVEGLASCDLSSVTTMEHMFDGCTALTNPDFSGVDVSNVKRMADMFANCTRLETLDLSAWDTSSLETFTCMFKGCSNLRELNVTGLNASRATSLYGVFTGCRSLESVDLSSWDMSRATYFNEMFYNCSSLRELDLSNWEPALSAQSYYSNYVARRMFSGCTNLETIYATDALDLSDDFFRESTTFSGCTKLIGGNGTAYDTNGEDRDRNTYARVDRDGRPGYFTDVDYSITYDANDGSGNTIKVTRDPSLSVAIPSSLFFNRGKIIASWNSEPDGRGQEYTPGAVYSGRVFGKKRQHTLYAQWVDVQPATRISEGVYELELEGGQTLTIPDVPAGTAYRIYEETPEGWVLVAQENTAGVIKPLRPAEATFTNRYNPGTTSAIILAAKTIDGAPADDGAFVFQLVGSDGSILQTKTNGAGGGVVFDPIVYSENGEYNYTIRELAGFDSGITYDFEAEEVTVTVMDDGMGNRTARVVYANGGSAARFENYTGHGSLRFTKKVEGTADTSKEFVFDIEFRDSKGRLSEDELEYYVTTTSARIAPCLARDAGAWILSVLDLLLGTKTAHAEEPWIEYTNHDSAFRYKIEDGTLHIAPLEGRDDMVLNRPENLGYVFPWQTDYSLKPTIKSIVFDGDGTIYMKNRAGSYLFESLSRMEEFQLDWSRVDTSELTDISSMFKYCSALKSIDLSGVDFSNVTNCSELFENCTALESVNLSNAVFSNAKSFSSLFYYCSNLTSVNLTGIIAPNITYLGNMFRGCSSLQSIDLSMLDTSKVTSTSSLFEECRSLTDINLTGWDTSSVTSVDRMFRSCSSLTELDLSWFDTSSTTYFSDMFESCTSLETLDLRSFDFSNFSTYGLSDLFEGCSSLRTIYTSRDYPSNNSYGGSTFNGCVSLVGGNGTAYNTETGWNKAGTLYAKIDRPGVKGYFTGVFSHIDYYANDGTDNHVLGEDLILSDTPVFQRYSDLGSVFIHQDKAFVEWNTEPDGTGTSYMHGDLIPIDTFAPGETKTLYAIWRDPIPNATYTVRHWIQPENFSTDHGTYQLAATERFTGDEPLEVVPAVKDYAGYIAPEPKSFYVLDGDVLDYYYDRMRYRAYYNGNGASSYYTIYSDFVGGVPTQLANNNYYSYGNKVFVGWNTKPDGTGAQYAGGQVVSDISPDGNDVTLYAQWADAESSTLEPTQGKVRVVLHAGETVVFPSLPAGTIYNITEVESEIPGGYTHLTAKDENLTGTISSGIGSTASMTNSYSARGSVNLEARKQMANGPLEAGDFTFELIDNNSGDVLDVASNNGLGVVRFSALEYTAADMVDWQGRPVNEKNFYYSIREVVPDEGDEDFDSSVEYDYGDRYVRVYVQNDGEGHYVATPYYETQDGEPPTFVNSYKTGSLTVEKAVENVTDVSEDTAFDFTLTLRDSEGNELEGEYPVRVMTKDYAPAADFGDPVYVHMDNVDDEGAILQPYDNNARWIDTVTIPGADLLKAEVALWSEQGWDWTYVWEGSHPEYSFDNVLPEPLFEGSGTDKTETVTIDGDSATFGFYSDGSVIVDGRGFFAVVQGMHAEQGVRNETVSSGGTISIKGGESFTVSGLPYGSTYELTEANAPGFALVDSTGAEGVITSAEPDTSASFTNRYRAYGTATLEATKTLSGRMLLGEQFDFELRDADGNALLRATNDRLGHVQFPPIAYTEADAGKTFTYTIAEINPEDKSYVFDSLERTAQVEVVDNGNGTLSCKVTYGEGGNAFHNEFTSKGEFTPTATKQLTGRELAEGAYTFELLDKYGTVVDTAVNAEDGSITFKTISFTQDDMVDDEGNQVLVLDLPYAIREVVGDEPGIVYDTRTQDLLVRLTDRGDGVISAKLANNAEPPVFVNHYEAAGTASITMWKELEGRPLVAGEFSFVLKDAEGNVLQTATNTASGAFAFGLLSYSLKDAGKTFTYTVEEVAGEQSDVIYDTSVKTVTVAVSPDKGDGTLDCTVTFADGGNTFRNSYSNGCEAQIVASKALEGRDLELGEFAFELRDSEGTVIQTVANGADGSVVFEPLRFAPADAGRTFSYTVAELEGADGDITYDARTFAVEVAVSQGEDGSLAYTVSYPQGEPAFKNTYTPPEEPPTPPTPEPPEPEPPAPENPPKPDEPTPPAPETPKTGDATPAALALGTALLGGAALLVARRTRRREL